MMLTIFLGGDGLSLAHTPGVPPPPSRHITFPTGLIATVPTYVCMMIFLPEKELASSLAFSIHKIFL